MNVPQTDAIDDNESRAFVIPKTMEFPDTHWTILAVATMNGGDKERQAMDQLCRDYWRLVAACIQARGAPSERVEDLTQDFFLQLMEAKFFKKASREKGRFRTFILSSLRYFLADDAKHHLAQKRGGHLKRTELNEASATIDTDDTQFDLAWAELIFDRVFTRTKEETISNRGEDAWENLRQFLPGSTTTLSYFELANMLGMTEGGAKAEVSRLRKRFREALRSEVGRTVSAPHEIDEELAHLRATLEKSAAIN